MSEQEEISSDAIVRERLSQLAKEIGWVEKRIPEVIEEYEKGTKQLEECTDSKQSRILRANLREKRLYLKQLENRKDKLSKEIWFLLNKLDEGEKEYV